MLPINVIEFGFSEVSLSLSPLSPTKSYCITLSRLQIIEGLEVIDAGRKMVGATNPLKAEPGTIRGDYAQATGRCVSVSSPLLSLHFTYSSGAPPRVLASQSRLNLRLAESLFTLDS